jgi:polyisoprenoid-binding protein YceI
MKKLLILLAAAGLSAAVSAADTWNIDSRHSGVTFSVRNFFVPVEGTFKIQSGAINFDASNPSASSVEAVIAVGSVNTQDADRDKHLLNQDFFLTDKFPTATFKSTSWTPAGEGKFKVSGELTIKDVTKPLTLEVSYFGQGAGNRGRTVSGWQAKGVMNRKDWGISYGASIADEVSLTINVQGVKAEAPKQG